MTGIQTYQGVVRRGRIHLNQAANLPEGSQVYVLFPGDEEERPLLDVYIARRKANGWLVTNVGSVIAQQPHLQQMEGRLAWRFKAFLATQGKPLRGPVGLVDVDAYSGEVLNGESSATEMIANATVIARSLPSSES
jgi:hypothetical protein